MHEPFDHRAIETKWQEKWKADGLYDAGARDASKPKEYVLVEWPYPSGNLHIGHWYAFAVPDIYVRFRRMNGVQTLYPIGFDAFGLPAENAAIKRDIDPREWTESNIAHMRSQLASMGNAYSWDKTTSSTDPAYYKWTQWMFTKFFENDIAYRGKGIVNWCPSCNTVLANEQVVNDHCERCGTKVEKREMDEWKLRITNYADRLVDDLDALQWPEHIKEAQRNWIGRSNGAELTFEVKNESEKGKGASKKVKVFTTRPDTLFGATYLVLAPEHELVPQLDVANHDEVDAYAAKARQKSEIERTNVEKEKTGVELQGVKAVNPANGEEIPVFVADYVLANYGTGAIMAVPAHDERDNEFARKFNLPIRQVIAPQFNKQEQITKQRHGVYGLIQDAEGKFLLQHFKNQNYYWLPGGKVEQNEDEISGLVREVEEETGYKNVSVKRILTETFYDYVSHRNETIGRNRTTVYEISIENATKGELQLTQEETNDGLVLEWVKSENINDVLKNTDEGRAELVRYVLDIHDGKIYAGSGLLVNSGEFDGMDSEEAKAAIVSKVGGKMTNTYRLRDWSIGRQRYWGVPIPIVYDPDGNAHPIPEEHLPWTLPDDVDFKPTGEPPLAKSKELKERTERIFGAGWTPEVETMDTFVDSSWYFLRYLDTENDESLSSLARQNEWMPIDIYFGGAEHTTMHLLYSRFWQKVLFDLGLATVDEPYTRRLNRGLVLGPDGNKMSKSKGNVIDPDEHVARMGADTVKMYLAFMGPYGEAANYPWDMGGIAGIRRFLERVYGLREHVVDNEPLEATRLLHKTIQKVRSDIPVYKFNTAIASMMVFINSAEEHGISRASYEAFLLLLAPFAPHLAEELWSELGNAYSIHSEQFPSADPGLAKDTEITIGVQVNGKVRGSVTVSIDADEAVAVEKARGEPSIQRYLEGQEVKKTIYVPNRILNFIVR